MDQQVIAILWNTFTYAVCGSLAAMAMRLWRRETPGPSLDQAAAVGALVGAGFGALVGVFQAMLNRL